MSIRDHRGRPQRRPAKAKGGFSSRRGAPLDVSAIPSGVQGACEIGKLRFRDEESAAAALVSAQARRPVGHPHREVRYYLHDNYHEDARACGGWHLTARARYEQRTRT